MSKKPNPELIDDENPEWTAADFAKARPASEVLPQIFGAKLAQEMLKPRGRPRAEHPKERINTACAQALEQGVYSYKRVQALSERIFVSAMAALDDGANHEVNNGSQAQAGANVLGANLAQQHELIRQADEYADLFTHAALAASAALAKAAQKGQGGLA